MELDSRLLKSENRFYAQYLLPRVVEQITNDQIVTIHQTYQMDIGLSLDAFRGLLNAGELAVELYLAIK